MSKKLAEGIQGLALDVKTGTGSFLPELQDSLALARTMVGLGEGRGIRTSALVTGMDAPLGRAVGNGLETREALECLAEKGPGDVTALSLKLAGEMLWAGGLVSSPEEGLERVRKALGEGKGLERMAELVEAQGGDPRVVETPHLIPEAPFREVVEASEEGFVHEVDPLALGYGVVELGGGRRRIGEELDPRVGFILEVAPGERVRPGAPLGEIHAADPAGLERGRAVLRGAVRLGETEPPALAPLVRERVAEMAPAGR
jgi:thymidine phosphorylase